MTVPIALYLAGSTRGWAPRSEVAAWAVSEGLDPNVIYRLEIYEGRARVFEYVKDEKGTRYIVGRPERRKPYDVAITSLPPGVTP